MSALPELQTTALLADLTSDTPAYYPTARERMPWSHALGWMFLAFWWLAVLLAIFHLWLAKP